MPTTTARRRRFLPWAILSVAFVVASIGPFAKFAQAAALECGAAKGAYVFVRPGGANGLGHVGWGYRTACSGSYSFGSVENPRGQAHIDRGADNGFWRQSGTESQMLSAMKSRGYQSYKTVTTSRASFDPGPANTVAGASAGRGYDVIGNNCADNVWDVLHAYGVPDLPYLQVHPAPNNWYASLGSTSNVTWSGSTGL
ncbi:hypothetical protein [Actinoplanes regularis]|uniref:DUF4105 domain-containing protein n=1 Tax=Actinoplanes regularis TaxID=52697 RepID=A0A238YAY4_9ACTN|nr:hypothetical protein [Actinoplanes regularis]GIE86056.1 hypothetical protein Are01nite_25360 [Actinoplanes regularis]GLW27755.1 hypothetical protein Areg01_06950 [Actinoplanes regularis]SNR67968.1 hypothetical protein SAMN06264365_104393 [Actinoplanes regularis]